MIRKIQRTALDRSLKAARALPDTAAALLGREDAAVALDKADAGVRDLAGRLLFDEELRDEARLRKTAAQERGRALKLRATAHTVNAEAEEELADAEAQAEQRRQTAAERAREREEQAERRRQSAREQAAKAAQSRKQTATRAEQAKRERIDAETKRERLDALETKAEALDKKADAATARDEALRLKRAAGEIKADRKAAQKA